MRGQIALWDELMEFTKQVAASLPTDVAYRGLSVTDMKTESVRLREFLSASKLSRHSLGWPLYCPRGQKESGNPIVFPTLLLSSSAGSVFKPLNLTFPVGHPYNGERSCPMGQSSSSLAILSNLKPFRVISFP